MNQINTNKYCCPKSWRCLKNQITVESTSIQAQSFRHSREVVNHLRMLIHRSHSVVVQPNEKIYSKKVFEILFIIFDSKQFTSLMASFASVRSFSKLISGTDNALMFAINVNASSYT